MATVLRHLVVGLACGGTTALLLIAAGTALLLSLFFGIKDTDAWVVGAYSGWSYRIAPIAGLAAFTIGILSSLIHGRLQQRDGRRGIVPSNKPQEQPSRDRHNRES